MKTAISIPDELFKQVELLARRSNKPRSQVFSEALKEYLSRHYPEEVTEAVDRVVDEVGLATDEFTGSSARRILDRTEW